MQKGKRGNLEYTLLTHINGIIKTYNYENL